MQLRRDLFLSSASTSYHGESGTSQWANISSLALEYSTHRLRPSMSISLSFHRLSGTLRRSLNLRSCSSSLTENQYLTRMMPSSMSIRSKAGH